MVSITETRDSALLAALNEEIQTLHHTLYPYRFKAYNHAEISDAFAEMMKNPDYHAYIAADDNVPAGYICLTVKTHEGNAFQQPYRTVYIDQIAVLSVYRHCGIGARLLDKAYELAKAEGITRLELDHWSTNDLAREFFGRHGFKYHNERMFKTT